VNFCCVGLKTEISHVAIERLCAEVHSSYESKHPAIDSLKALECAQDIILNARVVFIPIIAAALTAAWKLESLLRNSHVTTPE
jgi:hypothetical protein